MSCEKYVLISAARSAGFGNDELSHVYKVKGVERSVFVEVVGGETSCMSFSNSFIA